VLQIQIPSQVFSELWQAVHDGQRIVLGGDVEGLVDKGGPSSGPYEWNIEKEDFHTKVVSGIWFTTLAELNPDTGSVLAKVRDQRNSGSGELLASEFERLRKDFVEKAISIPEDASEEFRQKAKSNYSVYRCLLDSTTKAAISEATSKNLTTNQFKDMLSNSIGVVNAIQAALVQGRERSNPEKFWEFWRHTPLQWPIKEENIPSIARTEIEVATEEYLDLPFRCAAIDRLLIDVLVAMEMYGYGNDMWNENTYGLFPPRSPIKQPHILKEFLKGHFINAVCLGCVAAFFMFLNKAGIMGGGWAVGIALVSVSYFFLALGLGIIALPFAWGNQRKARKEVIDLMLAMNSVYLQLKSDRAISALHIRECAQKAHDLGVSWPAVLFTLLDDVIARTGRF
jgi:hypothetical protein